MTNVDIQPRNQIKLATDQLPEEQKKQAEGFVGGLTNVAGGVAGTAGGAVKSVVDTAGDTVSLFRLRSLALSDLCQDRTTFLCRMYQ